MNSSSVLGRIRAASGAPSCGGSKSGEDSTSERRGIRASLPVRRDRYDLHDAGKGFRACGREVMTAKPSAWRLMGVACGPREVDPTVHSAEEWCAWATGLNHERLGPRDRNARHVARAHAASELPERVMMHRRRSTLWLGILLNGCGLLPGSSLAEAPPECGFPPGTEVAFLGKSSLEAVALGEPGDKAEGDIFVTADRVAFARGDLPPARQFCVLAADGSMSGGRVRDTWTPPPPQ